MSNPNPNIKKIVDLPLVLTPKMVQNVLGISKSTAHELWFNPDFPGFLAQNRKFVSRDALCRFMKIPEDIIAQANASTDQPTVLTVLTDSDAWSRVPEISPFTMVGDAT